MQHCNQFWFIALVKNSLKRFCRIKLWNAIESALAINFRCYPPFILSTELLCKAPFLCLNTGIVFSPRCRSQYRPPLSAPARIDVGLPSIAWMGLTVSNHCICSGQFLSAGGCYPPRDLPFVSSNPDITVAVKHFKLLSAAALYRYSFCHWTWRPINGGAPVFIQQPYILVSSAPANR